jgi:hypothetical protein
VTSYAKSGGQRQRVPRAYLDTNLVSGIRREDLGAEQQALRRILAAHKQGTLALVTSHVTHEEIQRLPRGAVRESHEDIYSLLRNVPPVDEELLVPRVVTARPGPRGPVVVTQQDLATLRAILPDEDDARHLFHAISNGAEYFVTYDKATILKHRAAIEDEFSILPRLPSELATELGL